MTTTDPDRIEGYVWGIAAVAALGSVMSILDTTIVNVALDTLGRVQRAGQPPRGLGLTIFDTAVLTHRVIPPRPREDHANRSWSTRGLVGSATGAVPGLLLVRFPWPPAEPGVRLSTHRALRVSCSLVSPRGLPVSGSTGSRCCDRGSGNGSLRRWRRR